MVGTFVTRSPHETVALGRQIGELIRDGDVVLLSGDLGAGKTELTKGIAAGLGAETVVQSPTFVIQLEHAATRLGEGVRLLHLDLYRLDETALEEIGWADLGSGERDVVVVEWPERAASQLPERYLLVEIEHSGPDARSIRITRHENEERP